MVKKEIPFLDSKYKNPDDVWDDDEVEDSSDVDLDVVDYDEAKNYKFSLKINGEDKEMTFDQIQKQVARAVSASEKSREAKEQLASLETQQQELADRESRLDMLDISNQHDRELVTLDLQYRAVSEQIQNADGSVPKALLEQQQQIVDRFHTVQAEKAQVMNDLRVEVPHGLKEYVSSNLSKQVVDAIDPSMLKLIEKAKKWDESQAKIGKSQPKLKARKSMAKGSSTTPKPQSNSKTAKSEALLKKGNFAAANADDFLQSYLAGKN